MFCSYCGKQLNDSARFCSFCGKPVSASVIRPAQPTQPVQSAEPAVQTVEQERIEQQISEPVIQRAEQVTEPIAQNVEQERIEQQISEPVIQRAEQVTEPIVQNVEQVIERPISEQAFDRPAETINSATGKQLNEAPWTGAEVAVNTANVPNVPNVSNVPVKQEPERKYTFAHLMMCLASTAVFAIAAGIFAGLYFAGL